MWVNCFSNHNELTISPLGKTPFSPSASWVEDNGRAPWYPSNEMVRVRIVVFRTFYFCYFSNQLHSFLSVPPTLSMPTPIHDLQTWPGLHILYPRNGLWTTRGCNSCTRGT